MNISIKEIANKANVSKATVSRVINNKENVSEKTRNKIIKIMKEFEYVPDEKARNLSLGINNNIALIIPSDNSLYLSIVKKMNKALFKHNLSLLFYITDHNPELEKDLLDRLKRKSLGGLIYIKSPETNLDNIGNLDKLNIPTVVIADEAVDSKFDQINYSEKEISAKCVDILLKEGHKKIAYLCTPLKLKYEKKRYEGIIDTIINTGSKINMEDFYFTDEVTIEEGYRLTKKIIETKDYEAIYSSSNVLTMGILKLFKEKNIELGKNISLVSHGDLEAYNNIGYKITTVSISSDKLTEVSVDLLLERFKNRKRNFQKIELEIKPQIKGSEKIYK